VSAFARVCGVLLFFSFGSEYLALVWRDQLLAAAESRLRAEGQAVFVTLTRAQIRRGFIGDRYYYSYSGAAGAVEFHGVEEVSPYYFHSYSEGKNVEAIVYIDASRNAFVRLRGNETPFERNSPAGNWLSAGAALCGLALLIAGWLGAAWERRRR
jgi:hypothetical protein